MRFFGRSILLRGEVEFGMAYWVSVCLSVCLSVFFFFYDFILGFHFNDDDGSFTKLPGTRHGGTEEICKIYVRILLSIPPLDMESEEYSTCLLLFPRGPVAFFPRVQLGRRSGGLFRPRQIRSPVMIRYMDGETTGRLISDHPCARWLTTAGS
ncbi:hypothetical protein FN846DRAFT_202464 [Sphaerosporella brunnea]|uniref:Uncharacterized protein n=1 Tax=Sphaerosporella brunnea TaxID=1250544 RepID=A0A5J5F7L5_9PEZI|nr:hypothetical protein FN846DRAFT_202464 [Sphaerosporella brunnea]